jgi:hypothetical protein
VARRADDSPVRITLKNVADRHTLVAIRVAEGDKDLANTLHERLAARLGLGEAKGGWFGGNSLEAVYAVSLQRCVTAARRTFAVLDVAVTQEDIHATWAQIDARTRDSNPLRIKVEKDGDLRSKVTFFAGTSKDDDNMALAQRMKKAAPTAP